MKKKALDALQDNLKKDFVMRDMIHNTVILKLPVLEAHHSRSR